MPSESYDILKGTYCLYCQQDFSTPAKLQRHVLSEHKDTYASNSIKEARLKASSRPPETP